MYDLKSLILLQNKYMKLITKLVVVYMLIFSVSAFAKSPTPYGPVITLEQAKIVVAAVEVEAVKNNWPVAIVVVDSGANMILMHKLDNTQHLGVDIAIAKAKTSVNLRRSTKKLDDALAGGASRLLAIEGLMPIAGGIPIIIDGKIIGAVGVSGVTPEQDDQAAQAGVDALLLKK